MNKHINSKGKYRLAEEQHLLNVFIYDNSWTHRHKLKKAICDCAKSKGIKLGSVVSTSQPSKILEHSQINAGLYLVNIDDLKKTMDGIKFGISIRSKDLSGSIVFLTEHDIFATGQSDFVERTFRSHIIVMSFLAKDSTEYENEIKECISVHIRKISMS